MMTIPGLETGALVVIAIKFILDFFSSDRKKNTDALLAATHATTELKIEVKNLKEQIQSIPEIRKDLGIAYEKIRTNDEAIRELKAHVKENQ